jgi:acyl-CoA reductase-like NAD-dependent aldehyde dehydrogenase
MGRNGKINGRAGKIEKASRGLTEPASGDIPVVKTYKIFVGGKFPRSESGRYYPLTDRKGRVVANVCLCSRKDFRDAVVAARAAQPGWASRSAYNRGQVLYRLAEMLEGRSAQLADELVATGVPVAQARREVRLSVDRTLYYAGWCDKYQQVFSAVNPVASSHFNFSVPEPMGVVAAVAPQAPALAGLLGVILPAIAGGNSVVALVSRDHALACVSLAEALATSDLPGGVVNLLTGESGELLEHFAGHMDVNVLVLCDLSAKQVQFARAAATVNLKRVIVPAAVDWMSAGADDPYRILDLQEIKTTWHPVGL